MKVVLAAMGSRGDVQPMLALARALRAAGHSPVVCASINFAAWIEEHGLPFVSIGSDIEAWLRENVHDLGGNPLRMIRGFRNLVRSQAPHWFKGLLEASVDADIILGAAVFAASSVAELRGIPFINVSYVPTTLPTSYLAPLMVPWHGLPRWLNRVLWWFQLQGAAWLFREPIERGRLELGLPPRPDLIHRYFDRYPSLVAVDAQVCPPPPDWPAHVHTTGYWFYEDDTPLDPGLEAFLEAGPPPVYVGFGSMITKDPERLTRELIELSRLTGRRLLVYGGWAGLGNAALPPGCLVIGPTPHARLFPRVAAVVHHGGSGTTASVLRAGTPQVVVPHAIDQFFWAHRMEALELAPAPLPATKLTAKALAARIDAAIKNGAEARAAMAARIGQSRGRDHAVRVIEQTAPARCGSGRV